ncbi:hypothetical protein U1Q18_042452 [Sarracenia purpurea var. burkii]
MNVDEGRFVQCVIAVQLMMTTCVLHARGCWLKKEEVMMNFSCRPSKYAVCGWVLITDLDDFKPHWSIACLWFWDSSSFNLRIFDGCYVWFPSFLFPKERRKQIHLRLEFVFLLKSYEEDRVGLLWFSMFGNAGVRYWYISITFR